MEEELPVDVRAQLRHRGLDGPGADERRHGAILRPPRNRCSIRPSGAQCEERLPLLLGMEHAQSLLLGTVRPVELGPALAVEQLGDDAGDARSVEHVNRGLRELGRDLDRRVLA